MKKTEARLADGREIVYFDESENAVRAIEDPRDLPATATASELRYDAILGEEVVVASHRQGRTHLPPSSQCPLCPSTPDRQTEIPSGDYDVVVFENRFPSLAFNTSDARSPAGSTSNEEELFGRRPGAGRCEVVCFTSRHETSFAELSPARVRTVVEAWADRTRALSALAGVEQVFPFENRGREIGVTLSHPHGQIYAFPFVTPVTRRMLESARLHHQRTGRSLFADVLAAERDVGERIVASSEHWTAFVPYAARWPFEVHLYPHRQLPDLPALSAEERSDFCDIYLDILRRFDRIFDVPLPYIAAWHQAPVSEQRDLAYLHLRLFTIRRAPDKLKYLAGSESGMGVFINDIAPERAATMLREAGR